MENENTNQTNVENSVQSTSAPGPVVEPTLVVQPPQVGEPAPATPTVQSSVPEAPAGQPIQSGTSAPAEKKSNKALIFIIIGVAVVTLAVAGFLFLGKGSGKGSGGPDRVSKDYLENLISKNYSEAFKFINLPENSFVDANEYSEYVQKKDSFKKLTESKIKSKTEDLLTDNKATYTYTLTANDKEYTVKVDLVKSENGWKVEDKFYIEKYSILVPKDTKFYINDKLVPTSLIAKTNVGTNNLCDQYLIPAIYESQKKLKVESSFGTYEEDLSTVSSNSGYQIKIVLTDEDLVKKAQDFIKDMWNDMYVQYEKGTDVAEIKNKYFDDNITLDTVNTYYKNGFKEMINNSSKTNYSNLKITDIINRTDKEGYENYICANDILSINFGYSAYYEWHFMNQGPYKMNRYSKMRLRYNNGEFKVYEVSDEKFFTYLNSFTKEFKL
jgi:hypothetical protein